MMRTMILTLGTTVGMLGISDLTPQAQAGGKWGISINFGRPAFYPQRVVAPRPAFAPPVVAPVRIGHRRHLHHYHVFVRTCAYEPWRLYGTYRSHSLAHEIVDSLQYRGYQARVVHH